MQISLYVDRGSFVHRLHPTLKIFGLLAAFWSIYWVDNPLTLVPIHLVMLALAECDRRGPNFYRFRWFFVLIILPTMITWMISYRRGRRSSICRSSTPARRCCSDWAEE